MPGMSVSEMVAAIGALSGARVVCVGDVMVDRFVYGEVTRISPEAPIPVCRVQREEQMLGGAGNVARNLVALGAAVEFVSVVGEDDAGAEIARLIDGLEGVAATLLVDAARMTTVKTRYFATGQQLLRADRESAAPIAPALEETIVERVSAALDGAGALILSDYGKGVLTASLTGRLIAAANRIGRPVIVDPKGDDYGRYRGASLLTPNRHELREASRMAVGDGAAVCAAARRLIVQCGVEAVLVTRGAEGMSLVGAEAAEHLPAEAREVFDVSGAGDTVVATVAAARAAGLAPGVAARLANLAAGIVVARTGTAVAPADELVAALRARELLSGEGKLVAPAAAFERIDEWRRHGARIGFTNGCFDLIHPGHVSLLAQARTACDRLVVGLNADASVARLKGRDRPVQSEAARAAVLGALASVDLVIIFAEDTPMALIERIRPDLLVKGADYSEDQVVGAAHVRAYGGAVLLAELAPGHSTSATIARLTR
jgi:D-beta-D-heptose 7-phosphate kinase / D-beta-D-heptose 1-phosphate adenosyltransferase